MKRISISALLFLLSLHFLQAQAISINTDGSSPDTSAILDVKSSGKGILVPRMDSSQRVSIPLPAAGLLVYETGSGATANAFWYNAGTPNAPNWVRLPVLRTPGNCSPLTITPPFEDCDEDTRIHVEKTYDEDIIRMDLGDNIANNINPNPTEVLVLRKNNQYNTANPRPNTMLQLIDPSGGENTFVGFETGQVNTYAVAAPISQGALNTGLGYKTLKSNGTGSKNTAVGASALVNNQLGNDNTATGYDALNGNVSGHENTAMGAGALFSNYGTS